MTTETKIIESIRTSYMEKESTKLDELKKLDRKAKLPVKIFAYVLGSVSALVLGTGMSLVMKVIGESLTYAMPLGICIGIVGIVLASINYPLYKDILSKRKKKYAKRIFEMTDELLNR